ncbi:MAG TPA: hypothetical protein VGP07_04220 [Polyangia bacterium]
MSKTLEAILSKSDGDDDPVVPVSGVGTKTLMGIGISGLPLPPPVARAAKTDADDHPVSVDDMFDDDDEPDAVTTVSGEDQKVGDLLDEVAEALNVQAAESRGRAIGGLPGMSAPAERASRAADAASMPTDDEFEFEDPDDGPTTLNSGGDVDGEDVDLAGDDEEEAVVLGPAKLPGAHPIPIPAPSLARAAHPVPGGGPPAGLAAKRATPFAGLPAATLPTFPAPGSPRVRLPTPAPGRAAASIPAPAGTRSGPPHGTPVDGVPQAPSHGDSSRRSAARGTSGASEKSGSASAAVRTSLTSAMESASVVLKKDVKFRVASFGGVVGATLVVGILIGRAVLGGGKATPAAEGSGDSPAAKVAKAEEAAKPAPASAAQPPAGTVVANAAPVAAVPIAVGGQPGPGTPVVAPASPVEEAPGTAAPMAFDPQPIHKRRARRATLVAKEDSASKVGPSKPTARNTVTAAPTKGTKAPAATSAKSSPTKKGKSTWHDPFAD